MDLGSSINSGRPKKAFGARHIQILFGFIAAFLSYALRVNLSVALVAMKSSASQTVNLTAGNEGLLSSMFFYGYIVATFPASAVANKFKPRIVLSTSSILSGLLTVAFPFAFYYSTFPVVCILRVLLGLSQGPCFPCISSLIANWALSCERGRFMSFAISGLQAGSAAMFIVGGFLASSTADWANIFYFSGGVSIVWGILSYIFVCNSVEENKYLPAEERICLEMDHDKSVTSNQENPVPWKKLFSSVPVWTMMIVALTEHFCTWIILSLLPTYLNGVFHFDIAKDGVLSALPSFSSFLSALTLPFISDYLANRLKMSLDVNRKFWNSIALYSGTVIFLVLSFCSLDASSALSLLILFSLVLPGVYYGYMSNSVDLSPNYSSILMGLLSSVGAIGSCLAPTLGGIIVRDSADSNQWRILFIITAAMAFAGNTIYLIFGSSKIQHWN